MATLTEEKIEMPAGVPTNEAPTTEAPTLDFVDLSTLGARRAPKVNPLESLVGTRVGIIEINGDRDAVTIRYRPIENGKFTDAEGVMALSMRHSRKVYDAATNPALGGKVLAFTVERGKRGYILV